MAADLLLVFGWWLVWFLAGLISLPITHKIFGDWDDKGYGLTKIIGVGLITWGVWIAGITKILSFNQTTIIFVACGVAIVGIAINRKFYKEIPAKLLITEEILFLSMLFFWSFIKGHEPSINGLEKFMDFGFTQSILNGAYFPPKDMWFAGGNINYYYFGHLMMAVLTKISGIGLGTTFNLMLCTIFSLTATMTWTIVRRLLTGYSKKWKVLGATITMLLMVFAGNLQTIYAFTQGYSGDDPPPFWKILSNISDKESFEAGWKSYWYPNATRFIPFSIHEFPAYSFVVSDVHGHVLDLPIALLCIGLLINMFAKTKPIRWWEAAIYGFVTGWAFTTNALDGVIYLGLWGWLRVLRFNKKIFIELAIVSGFFILSVSPFVIHFKSFVSGLGVNCPPASMENKKVGPLLFETVNKCQKSPLWMWLILWGFFWYCGLVLAFETKDGDKQVSSVLLSLVVFSLGLTIFPEFFYFKDIYPDHFRSNTMFKLGYQAYVLMMLVSGYAITKLLATKLRWQKIAWITGLVPLIFLIAIYPLFSIKSYFGKIGIENYKSLQGLAWIEDRYPDENQVINWLISNNTWPNQPVILEGNGDSYREQNMISAFTGFPTLGGWLVHEWLWRSYEQISDRNEDIRRIYEFEKIDEVKYLLTKYTVKYVIVGDYERQKFNIPKDRFEKLAKLVFESGAIKVYQVL